MINKSFECMHFPNSRVLHRSCIYNNVRKYDTCMRCIGEGKFAIKSVRSPTNSKNCSKIQRDRRVLQQNSKASARRYNVPDIRKSSFNRITWIYLTWHPFKINMRHNLDPMDFVVRIQYNPTEILLKSSI